MIRIHEVVARIEVAVVLDDGNIAARRPEYAKRMLLPERYSGGLFEYLHFDSPDVSAYPFIENGTEKTAPCLSRYRQRANAIFSVRLWLDHRQKAHVRSFDLLEEPVYFGGIPNIMGIDHTQDISIDTIFSQCLYPCITFS